MSYAGVTIPEVKGNFLGKHLSDQPNTHKNCKLDWSMQRHAMGSRLIASVARVFYRPQSGQCECTAQAKYDIYDCLSIKRLIRLIAATRSLSVMNLVLTDISCPEETL